MIENPKHYTENDRCSNANPFPKFHLYWLTIDFRERDQDIKPTEESAEDASETDPNPLNPRVNHPC